MKGTPILLALILLLGGSFSLPSLSHASNPSATPTIDGSSVQGCSHFTNSCSTLFSTSRSNDIVIVYTSESLDLQASCSFSVKDTAGLSWEMRAAVSGRNDGTTGSDRDQIAEFWARSATPLSSDNITESILGCASYQYGGEYNGLMVFGISGANFNNPFDPNGSIPASVSGYNGTPASLISTSNPSDMILGVALQSTFPVLSAGSGFTLINGDGGYMVSEYAIVNSPATSFPVTFGDGANWYWEVIADAVQAANTAPDFGLSASPSSLTITAGSSGTSTVTVTSVNNFTGTVDLQATVTPAGPSLNLNPSSVPVPSGGSGSSVLNVSTTNATAPGFYKLTVTGTSGSSSHTTAILVTIVSPAAGSLGIDASAEAGCGHDTNSCSATLSTLHGYDLIIVYAIESLDLQTSCNFSVNDTAGLYWTLRGSASGRNDGTTGSNRDQIAEFWAASPGVLSNDIITERISGCASIEYGGEYNDLIVVAVSGANLSNPFDPNNSLPGSANGYSNTPSMTLSTSNSQDMIISAAQQTSYGTLTPGPGFTQIFLNGAGLAVEYQTANSPQTNLTITYVDDTTWYWEIIGDAVQAASTTPDFTLTTSPSSLTITAGSSGTSTVTVTSVNNFTGTVDLQATVTPAGPSLILNPSSVPVPPSGSESSVLTISTDNTTSLGFYTITVTGTSASNSRSTKIIVTVVSPAPGPLGIDSSAEAICGHNTNSCSATLSTLHGSDLVIVYTMEVLDLQTSCNFSVNDTAGLVWTLRGSVSGRNDGTTGSDRDQLAEFWAVSPSVLSSDIITESISGCASFEYGGEYNSLLVVAVAGANLSSPFDPDVSLPASASGYNNTPTLALSTSNGQDLIISAGQQSSYGTLTPGPGFSQIFSNGPGWSAEEYQTVNAPQTNLTVTYVDDTTWYWEIMGDAVQAAPPDPAVQQTVTFDGVTVSLSGNFIINTTSRTVTGTISVTATNSTTGQTLFSKTFTISLGYGSRSTARFVLSVPAGSSWLGATCSINASTDTASCVVSRDPDVDHDGVISLLDVSQVFLAYGSSTGNARYNPSLDLYGYGTVNLFDASLAAIDYGLPVFS
ncbi:hypothetical protein E6H28_05590 [Candidatus Bathyarchaeota archaeon]|nr:MAG: hypothetical protein E6H28_05590 [Candidatus Bathyarchaeota archaeon]